ncbi:MAG: hypothetical protein K8R77_07035 [Anaerolineaceae bacterium]|nr:hypothetical protein [Anaerolineaceae bacterium]
MKSGAQVLTPPATPSRADLESRHRAFEPPLSGSLPAGFMRMFVDAGEPMRRLLADLQTKSEPCGAPAALRRYCANLRLACSQQSALCPFSNQPRTC